MAKNVENKAENEAREARKNEFGGKALNHKLSNDLRRHGYMLGGLNFKYGIGECIMTVKVPASGEGPLVAFEGGRDPISCLKKFMDKLAKDKVNWRPDEWVLEKFAQTEEDW